MSARHTFATTSLGDLLLVAESGEAGDALIGVYFPGHTYPPAPDAIGDRVDEGGDRLLAQAARELREYLAGDRREFDVPIATHGDELSERVWQRLRLIPYGETTTYGTIATELGSPGLAQRVGQAVGHNPLSIVIPCHRVLGANGSLTGFAGGLERKRRLLELEEPDAASAGRLF
jgi:methylated-DNA-[protein]-cysteine S-methyltransferase